LRWTTETSRLRSSRRSNQKLSKACIVVVAMDKYQMCSARKPDCADNHKVGITYVVKRRVELMSCGFVLPPLPLSGWF
jgi:hypothetical protein